MKKVIASLLMTLFIGSLAIALTVESDYISNNKGKINGKFQKTQAPLLKQVRLNGWETLIKPQAVGVGTAECRMYWHAGATTAESYVYFIGKTTAGNSCYRSISFEAVAGDAVTVK